MSSSSWPPSSSLFHAASKIIARDPKADTHALLEVHEGIVPGLDFCNHHVTAPKCWWEVSAPEARQPPSSDAETIVSSGVGVIDDVSIQLRLHRGAPARPGDELMISYGDKSNEELLMLYGFAVLGNRNDAIMLHCPLPPASAWDQVIQARVELVQVCVANGCEDTGRLSPGDHTW